MCSDTKRPSRVRFLGPGKRWKVQGYVAHLGDEKCVVAFRGSVQAMNWVADMRAVSERWPPQSRNGSWCEGCRVHTGFVSAYEELRGTMMSALADFGCSTTAITGHSLGAALATLAAADLRATTSGSVHPVFTYGSPRVGNHRFVDTFDALAAKGGYEPPQWRLVHYHDPVPRISPTVEGFGLLHYEHTGEEVYYTEDNSDYKICPSSAVGAESPSCSAKTPLWKCITFDHLNYLNQTFEHMNMPSECTGNHAQSRALADAAFEISV